MLSFFQQQTKSFVDKLTGSISWMFQHKKMLAALALVLTADNKLLASAAPGTKNMYLTFDCGTFEMIKNDELNDRFNSCSQAVQFEASFEHDSGVMRTCFMSTKAYKGMLFCKPKKGWEKDDNRLNIVLGGNPVSDSVCGEFNTLKNKKAFR
jgi:hypothetical protein